MHKNKLIYIILIILSVGSRAVFALPNTTETLEEPRWFEIEVIVYKQTNNQGLLDEKWDQDTKLDKTSELVDFLQPYLASHELYEGGILPIEPDNSSPTEENSSINKDLVSPTETSTLEEGVDSKNSTEQVTSVVIPVDNSVTDIHSLDEEALLLAKLNQVIEEKPFLSLKTDLLQLKDVVASLKRHPDYKILSHLGWRQPVLGKDNAVHVRIAGGQDFSQDYDYHGNKLIPSVEMNNTLFENNLAVTPDGSTVSQVTNNFVTQETENFTNLNISPSLSNNEFLEQEVTLNTDIAADDSALSDTTPLLSQITAQPWVPELDGDIKIYLKQFLHINTNLFLRRPDQQEVDTIEFDSNNSEALSTFNQQSNTNSFPVSTSNESIDSLGLNAAIQTDGQHLQSSEVPQHQFSWDIEDDFLESNTQKIYIEKLFNYPLKQSRRVRSGELHFFDHPLLGMLIMIRPYERQAQVISEELSVNN